MAKKCDGCGKKLMFLEGNVYIPPTGSNSKRGVYKKVKEETNL